MTFLDLIKEQDSIKMAQINVQLSFISPIHRRKEMVHILCEETQNWGFSCPFSISRRVICLLWPDKCSTEHHFLSLVGNAGQLVTTEFIFIVLKKHSGWTYMGTRACFYLTGGTGQYAVLWWHMILFLYLITITSFLQTCTHPDTRWSIKASKLNGKGKKGEKCWY